jgi:hypothetical protein
LNEQMNSPYPPFKSGRTEAALVYIDILVYQESENQRSVTIMFICNHAVADGVSLCHSMHQFINHLTQPDSDNETQRCDTFPDNLVEKVKELFPHVTVQSHFQNQSKNAPQIPASEVSPLYPLSVGANETADQTLYYYRESNNLKIIQEKCREHGVTFNSCFVAITEFASAEMIAESSPDKETIIVRSGITLNARSHLLRNSIPDDLVGYYVSGLEFTKIIPASITRATESEKYEYIWTQSKQSQTEIKEGLQDKEKLAGSLLVREAFSNNILSAMESRTINLGHTIGCSNIGDVSKIIQSNYGSTISVHSTRVMSGINMWKNNSIYFTSMNGTLYLYVLTLICLHYVLTIVI